MSGLRTIRIIDTETTGLPENGKVDLVEIAYTDLIEGMDGRPVYSKGPCSSLVAPTIPISFGAMATHHITEDIAASGVSQLEAHKFIAGANIYAAHNAAFDREVLNLKWHAPWICTLKCAREAWPEMESHSNGALRYALGLCLSGEEAEKAMPAHRAGPDTWVTAHILMALSSLFSIDEMIEISKNPNRLLKIPFGKHRGTKFSELPADYLDWIVNISDMRNDKKSEDVVYSARLALTEKLRG